MSSTRRRSLTASLITAGTELVVFAACAALLGGKALLAARWLVGASGSSANFVINRRWAFARRDTPKRQQGTRFALATVAAVSLATAAWAGLVHLGVDPRVAHVGSMAGVWLVFTYPLMKTWVFRPADA